MRSFRTMAVAVATAAAVTLTGTTVASAQSSDQQPTAASEGQGEPHAPSNNSEFFDSFKQDGERTPDIEDDRDFIGHDAFGDETRWDKVNNPAKAWIAVTYAGLIGTVIGGIIGAVNWLKCNGILSG